MSYGLCQGKSEGLMPTMSAQLGLSYSSLPNAGMQPSFNNAHMRLSDSHTVLSKLSLLIFIVFLPKYFSFDII